MCFRSVFIISVKKAFDLGERPASQSGHLSYAEKIFGIRRYSSLPSGDGKKPRRRTAIESLKTPPLRLPGLGLFPVQYYNRPVRKKSPPNGLERTGADIKPEMLKTIISCITNKIFHYQKMKRNTQNPASCTPFTSHSWNRYGRQERLPSPLHKRSRSRMNAVMNLQNHKFMNARIL